MSRISTCNHCCRPFKGSGRYCSRACELFAWRDGSEIVGATPCYYCRRAADTTDHVPPQSKRQFILSQGWERRFPFREVPSCFDCNSVLGARLWTLEERRQFIAKRIARRYQSALRTVKAGWTDGELRVSLMPGQVSRGGLLEDIRSHLIMGEIAKEMLAWASR